METHIHNDYVTGGLALAEIFNADYIVPAGPALSFQAIRIEDAQTVDAGPLKIRAISTPGHTDSHMSYLVHIDDDPALAAFTGGSVLLGGTGRTDLLGRDRTIEMTKAQYWTARRLTRVLPPNTRLLPTHGFGASACFTGSLADAASGDTFADQLQTNPALNLDESTFIRQPTNQLHPIPQNYPVLSQRNLTRPTAADLSPAPSDSIEELIQRRQRGEWILDLRPRSQHAASRIPGSVNIDNVSQLAAWTNWLIPTDEPVSVIGVDEDQIVIAQRELARVGVDRLAASAKADKLRGVDGLVDRPTATFKDLAALMEDAAQPWILDIRDQAEWEKGHLRGASHLPIQQFSNFLSAGNSISEDTYIYCGIGFRAAIAASYLSTYGIRTIAVDDELRHAKRSGIDWCTNSCPSLGECSSTQSSALFTL